MIHKVGSGEHATVVRFEPGRLAAELPLAIEVHFKATPAPGARFRYLDHGFELCHRDAYGVWVARPLSAYDAG